MTAHVIIPSECRQGEILGKTCMVQTQNIRCVIPYICSQAGDAYSQADKETASTHIPRSRRCPQVGDRLEDVL